MVAVTLPLLSSNLPDKPDIYWQITKAPYLEKPQPKLDFSMSSIDYKYTFKETTAPIHHIHYVVWNVLDVYTTHQAINVGGYATEANPFLPKKPSLRTLITRKILTYSFLHSKKVFEKEKTLKFWNLVGTGVVLHNFNIMHQHGDFL
ncbi:MAG: hypothetical protein CMI74_08505 [Candidatus Pelagibacter sp.]|nr:hypothetical protein [Candidatus Pelagibacter sp.]|tara:strand:+ start:3299 stop:3739 length:441 start_codon:yes stop_codon:yes gene_type:complete